MGISHIHVHKNKKPRSPAAPEVVEKRDIVKRDTLCNLYLSPTMGQTIDSLQPLTITWNSSCIADSQLDIYLISPTSDHPRIHLWQDVPNAAGTYTAELMPRWWNATASQLLQFSILPHSSAVFASGLFAPPVFTATYTQPASGMPASANTNVIDSGVTVVGTPKKPNHGKYAAAVLVPLIFIALCIGAYIRHKRSKGIEKRKRWTQAVDKRMSTISTDWKSVSGAGANAAIRNSMAVGNRNSSFSFGALRPASTYAVEGEDAGSAGVGAAGRQMSQMRTGVGLRNPVGMAGAAERVSRVSFAPDTRVSRVSFADSRPSGESRRTRAFHSAYIPPVPALPEQLNDTGSNDHASDEATAQFSPRQTQGPITLTPEDIRARAVAGEKRSQEDNNLADFMPALSMMRTQSESDDYLLPTPASPPPAFPKPLPAAAPARIASPVIAAMPMQPMPASVMSPDEMLRAYAERKKMSMGAAPKGGVPISYPMPVAHPASPPPASNNMRVLYNATPTMSPTNTGNGAVDTAGQWSMPEAYPGYAVGGGNQNQNQYAFGHHPNVSIGVGAYGGAQYAI
ncbi:hypothetical protein BJ912DRAFT_881343, partial [Pholiota molesta]